MSDPPPNAGLSPEPFADPLREVMYQVALLLHPEERSRQRVWNAKRSLQELSARTEMLDADGERQAQLQHAIAEARQALGAVTELGENTARKHFKDASDHLSEVLRLLDQ